MEMMERSKLNDDAGDYDDDSDSDDHQHHHNVAILYKGGGEGADACVRTSWGALY